MGMKRFISTAILLCLGIPLVACEQGPKAVIATSGTVLGIDIAQNPATQTPHAKLGYNRGELAIVPTVHGLCVVKADPADNSKKIVHCPGNVKTDEVPDVLMEVRVHGFFSTGDHSGIYQRLAIGKNAVEQPGAAFLFARGPDGKIEPSTARALEAVSLSADYKNQAASISECVFPVGGSFAGDAAAVGRLQALTAEAVRMNTIRPPNKANIDRITETDQLEKYLAANPGFGNALAAAKQVLPNPCA